MNIYLEQFVDTVGDNGHILLPLCVIGIIFYMKKYVWGFICFLFINECIISVLKEWIREKRPEPISNDEISYSYYGMPSGHSQHVMFSFMYLFMLVENGLILLSILFMCFVVMFERYKNKRHTFKQITVGGILGLAFGYISFVIVKQYIRSGDLDAEDE